MDALREIIVSYFKTKDKIMLIVERILDNTMSMDNIPVEYTRIENQLIRDQATILFNRQKYDQNKDIIESAVNFYLENRNRCSVRRVAKISGVHRNIIKLEVAIADRNPETIYCYNRRVIKSATSLTYEQEYKLEKESHHEFFPFSPCLCRICYLLKLSTFAYEFVKKYNYPYPPKWDENGVDFKRLQTFEMVFCREISRVYKMNCIL